MIKLKRCRCGATPRMHRRPGSRFPYMVICGNCLTSTSFIRGGEEIAASVWNTALSKRKAVSHTQ